MTTFESLDLPEVVLTGLKDLNITTPTPIQNLTIPEAIQGHDLLASSQTGSGKTLAYLIPMIMKLMQEPERRALILVPTRELAKQVDDSARALRGHARLFRTAVLIGGEAIQKQFLQLQHNPRVIIATPGRLHDHLRRTKNLIRQASFLVLDETDRMLDMGFSEQLDEIRPYLPEERQTLMFSATMPKHIERVAAAYLKEPKRLAVGVAHHSAPTIEQESIHLPAGDKIKRLLEEIETREGSIIVFVKTKRGADNLAEQLQRSHHKVEAIHGDLKQRQRDQVIKHFRGMKTRILVATDVAARGLDVPHVQHVINFDLPTCPEDFIHRIGRTGRAGNTGCALSFITSSEQRVWRDIQRMMKPDEHKGKESFSPRNRPEQSSRKPKAPWKKDQPASRAPRRFDDSRKSKDTQKPWKSQKENFSAKNRQSDSPAIEEVKVKRNSASSPFTKELRQHEAPSRKRSFSERPASGNKGKKPFKAHPSKASAVPSRKRSSFKSQANARAA